MTCTLCNKNDRAIFYCRRGDCPSIVGTRVDLPRPEVEVLTNGEGKTHVVVSRRGSEGSAPLGRSYEVSGTSPNEKIKDAVEKILGDTYSAEWIPRR
jgi:hypothetical protein